MNTKNEALAINAKQHRTTAKSASVFKTKLNTFWIRYPENVPRSITHLPVTGTSRRLRHSRVLKRGKASAASTKMLDTAPRSRVQYQQALSYCCWWWYWLAIRTADGVLCELDTMDAFTTDIHLHTSVAILAVISLRSARKLFIYTIKKHIYRINVT